MKIGNHCRNYNRFTNNYYPSFKASEINNINKMQNDVDRYTSTMLVNDADLYYAKRVLFLSPTKSVILDVGSNNGMLCRELRKVNPYCKTINVDLSSKMHNYAKKLDKLAKLTNNTKYIVGNAFGLPIKDGCLDAIICNRALHEIYSYESGEYKEAAFSMDSVYHFFSIVNKKLKDGGKLLINDCARPRNPYEMCFIKFNSANYMSNKQIVDSSVTTLQGYNLLKRFCFDFEPAKCLYSFNNKNFSCIMPKWLVGEFIRHRKFNDTGRHWMDEMNESYCGISREKCMEIGTKIGFKIREASLDAKGGEFNYYHFDKNDFLITNSVGQQLCEINFPQHYHIIFQKPYKEFPKCSLLMKNIKWKNIIIR